MLQTAGEVSAVALAAGIIVSALQWISESPDRVVAFADVLAVCVLPLVGSVSALGNIYVWKRLRLLQRELHLAQEELNYLQEKLERPNTTDLLQGEDKEIRIFMDGAFDLLHFGHMNAFRLARSLGTHLIVGVNSDASITECKGEPLMNDNERLTMVSSCKFVDEVIPECPYIMSEEYLSWAIKTYRIDYVVHGDDPCIVDGKDVYASAKEMGKFRTIPRTCGVSTTDIVGRMLLLTKDHHYHNTIPTKKNSKESLEMELSSLSSTLSRNASSRASCLGKQSKFLTTNRMLQLFGAGVKAPTKCMRVIYIDGAWDLFHPGHVAILKVARERGDYLIVGILGDDVVNRIQGMNLPLMNLHERVLSVLGCRHIDDVLIDAPYDITNEMISTLGISEVVQVKQDIHDGSNEEHDARYKCAQDAGIFNTIKAESNFRIGNVIQRIQRNQNAFQAKFERKMKAEQDYIDGIAIGNANSSPRV